MAGKGVGCGIIMELIIKLGPMSHFEIEIKSLLGSQPQAEALKTKMQTLDGNCACVARNTQLNHYFKAGDILHLYENAKSLFDTEQQEKFLLIVNQGEDFSIRTRQKDDEVLLVVKASIDAGDSANTVKRMEFEELVSVSLLELDDVLLTSGFDYQAKWSREREEYLYKDINVCIDKNAGYGYLAEFEKIVHDAREAEVAHRELQSLMDELEVAELEQDRLARMFAHYNANWSDYYGTEKTFMIE